MFKMIFKTINYSLQPELGQSKIWLIFLQFNFFFFYLSSSFVGCVTDMHLVLVVCIDSDAHISSVVLSLNVIKVLKTINISFVITLNPSGVQLLSVDFLYIYLCTCIQLYNAHASSYYIFYLKF